jgi:hypothetical protein
MVLTSRGRTQAAKVRAGMAGAFALAGSSLSAECGYSTVNGTEARRIASSSMKKARTS